MKQLLFLLLFPAFAMAQYPGNAGQKITLGEQTTADGLVFRGVANLDTVAATSKITRANKQDTSAYILLDTVTNLLWHYKTASNGWIQAGGSTLDTATMLLPYYRAGRNTIIQAVDVPTLNQNTTGSAATLTTGRTVQTNLASTSAATFNGSANITPGVTGVLPVANGGTNLSSFTLNGVLYASSTNQIAANSNLTYDGTMLKLISTAAGGVSGPQSNPTYPFRLINSPTAGSGSYNVFDIRMERNGTENRHPNFSFSTDATNGEFFNIAQIGVIAEQASGNLIKGNLLFMTKPESAAPTERMRVTSAGEVWIGYTAGNGAYPLQVNGQIFATNATIATSDEKFKENITPLNKGLEIVNKLKPVTFNFISDTENNFSEYEEVGFIAQDVDRVLSTETFSKSIVKAADDSEPTSTMGLATQNLIPILTKAIQEQQALIKALEQRILILENK